MLVRGLKAVGSTQQVNLAVLKCLDGCFSGGKALDPDRQLERFAQKAGVICGEAFVVPTAIGHVERWIVGSRGADHEFALILQPVSLSVVQGDFNVAGTRAAEQRKGFTADRGGQHGHAQN